jgi:hypothetical protein
MAGDLLAARPLHGLGRAARGSISCCAKRPILRRCTGSETGLLVVAQSAPFGYLESPGFFVRVHMDDQATDKGTLFGPGGYAGLERSNGLLLRLGRLARRDALLMAAIVLAALLASFLVLQLTPKLYLARSTVVLDSVDMRVDPSTGEIATANILPIQIETEIDIMRSREFASRVADDLDLLADTFLNPESGSAGSGIATDELERQRDTVVTRLLDQYRLSRRGESLAIDIFTLHPDADRAALISNAVSEITITKSAEDRRARLQSTIEFLDARVLDMEADLARSEEELAAFIRDNELRRASVADRAGTLGPGHRARAGSGRYGGCKSGSRGCGT